MVQHSVALSLLALGATSVGASPLGSLLGSVHDRRQDDDSASGNATCSSVRQVKDWATFTDDEKADYISASVCLTEAAATVDLPDAKTVWDTLLYNHIYQVDWIHFVGQFLPWHRYFLRVHSGLLESECGYTGPLAFWNETAEGQLATLDESALFTDAYFGGNGAGATQCIDSGPFVNVTLAYTPAASVFDDNAATENNTCIFRDFDIASLAAGSSQAAVDECLAYTTFADVWDCIENGPHANGHGAVGGLMRNVANSPGEPAFFLHHHWVDLLWWRWQAADPDNRLYAISGNNVATDCLAGSSSSSDDCPGTDITDYDGDDGDTTTLDHVLWVMDIYPNVTVRDVMDINSSTICYEYVY